MGIGSLYKLPGECPVQPGLTTLPWVLLRGSVLGKEVTIVIAKRGKQRLREVK